MNNIYEEYTKYYELSNKREELESKLTSLVGKNDSDSSKIINEIAEEINKTNTLLSLYDSKLLGVVDKYYTGLEEVKKLIEDINLIEKISKKSSGEKIEIVSADGRKKMIDKEYESEYRNLTARKKEARKKNLDNYKSLKNVTSIVRNTRKEEAIIEEPLVSEFVLPEVKGYDDLSLDDKIKMTEERLDRIFKSSSLPNMGKKKLVTYNGKKYLIPGIYSGRFNDTVRELNNLLNKKNNVSKKTDEVISSVDSKEDVLVAPDEMVNNNRIFNNDQIVLHSVDVGFVNIPKISFAKAFMGVKEKINIEKFKKLLPSIYNIDRKAVLSFKKMESKLLDKGIKIKTNAVNLADNAIFKYNTAKTFVIGIPKRVSGFVTTKYSEFKKFLSDKEKIISNVKSGGNIKDSMEKVYGEDKENHLDYRIVNRTVKFKNDTCQRIDETKGNIAKFGKSVIDKIKEPLDRLKEIMHNDVERKDLERQIEIVKHDILMKKNELKRIKIKESIKTNGGYIAMSTLMIVGTISVAVIIFTIIGSLLR